MKEVKVKNINKDRFNPYEASAEELIAVALYDAGLVNDLTEVNGLAARDWLEAFFDKRRLYRDASRLGCLLIENNKVSEEKLKDALRFQSENKNLRLGEILVKMQACAESDITDCLRMQQNRRKRV